MHYISHIIERLLLPMTLKRNFLIFTAITFLAACTSTPFTELNSRDNFQLEEDTSFKIQLNKDLLPVEMDPILIENLGDAAKEYLEGVGHQTHTYGRRRLNTALGGCGGYRAHHCL